MARYTFKGAAPLYYTGRGLWAEPGKSYELADVPTDGNWVAESGAPVVAEPVVSAPVPAQVAVADAIPAPSPAEDAVHAAEALLEANPDLAAKILKENKSA